MKKTPVVSTLIQKIDHGTVHANAPDLLAVEEPLEIRLGWGPADNRQQQALAVTMRTPGNDLELVLGFLLTEGIIHRYDEVAHIHHCAQVPHDAASENVVRVELAEGVMPDVEKLQRNFYVTSSCGVCGKSSIDAVHALGVTPVADTLRVDADVIQQLPDRLLRHQAVFSHTGGLHAVALFTAQGASLLVREDVGRHNAFDKVVGASLIQRPLPFTDVVALVSGRASFELVQKAVVAGIPMLAAVGAPSSLAVDLARQYNLTLLGFVRDGRFNIYCGADRVRC